MSRNARATHLALGEVDSAEGVVEGVVSLIVSGALADGDWLPASRALAAQTGLSRGTVVRAFDELAAAGFVSTRGGSGTRVSEGAGRAARAGARTRTGTEPAAPVAPEQGEARSPRDLRPGIPDAGLVDEKEWRRAVRAAAGASLLGVNPWEEPSANLRRELRGHLRRHRGLSARDPLLFDSSRSAVAALCAAFCAEAGRESGKGAVPFHIEDPGYRGALLMAREQGLDLRFYPANPDGLDAELLGRERGIVYVTPAHHYPLGHRMSVERRVALARWASETGSLVIEDDYDGEYRYGVAPLPALATLPDAAEHVAYVGTSSKSVAPDLRVAWCAAPERLGRELRRWLAVHRRGPSALPAEALAAFIADGAMDRHLARAARTYSDRRARLVAALREHCPGAEITGVEAGLHLCVLTPGVDDARLADALAVAGWQTRALSSQSTRFALSGVILNYARLPGGLAREFAKAFARALEDEAARQSR
ncbi:aminotransferase-like domain-containing protein [Dietzia sp.]|uniref:aminotransferase-like domain-containing protein n=1 Tax=Dietzia sp. TaxID=1871616 RepID=UPI002FD9B002